MLLGRVAGTLVASRKDEGLEGQKFLVIRELGVDGKEVGGHVVAADSVGAGQGEVVLFATGSSARQTVLTDGRPIDAIIMAIREHYNQLRPFSDEPSHAEEVAGEEAAPA